MEPSAYAEFRDLEDRHWWFVGRKTLFMHLLRHRLRRQDRTGRTALDLGCGMGGMLEELGEFAETVLGSDIEPEALAHCKDRGFTRVFQASGESLPFDDASLDLITAFDTIEHIPQEPETLAECARILKPGGRMMISVPAYQFLYSHQDKVVHHQRRYTAGDLKRRLRAAGLEPEKVTYFNVLLFPLILPAVLLIKLREKLNPPAEGDTRTNVSNVPAGWVNATLAGIFRSERFFLPHLSMPTGHSLIAIAKKPER